MNIKSKNILVRTGAYLCLVIGVTIALAIVLMALIVLIRYPEAVVQKKIGIVVGLLIVSVLIALITIAIFELMLEVTDIEEKMNGIQEKAKK
ncbi:MAG: hypothetical protein WCT32_01730 [Patescibacteria group bacterium]|jgi:hypothetical protein